MKFIMMDDEGADLVTAGMQMAQAALEARARRVDPDQIISRSYGMSAIKARDVVRQLQAPGLAEFSELPLARRALLRKLCQMIVDRPEGVDFDVIYRKLRSVVLWRAEPGEVAIEGQQGPDSDPQKLPDAELPTLIEGDVAHL